MVCIILLTCISIASAGDITQGYTSANGIVPTLFESDNDIPCKDMGCAGTFLKIESKTGYSGTYPVGSGTITITTTDGQTIAWTSQNVDIDCIYMKGGNGGEVYCYNPPVQGDSGLSTPVDTTNNKPKGISHINICYTSGSSVPEFPTLALPVAMMIGFLGLVLFVRGTKEN